MVEYELEVKWMQSWGDGTWDWIVWKDGILVHSGVSAWRWSAKRAAKRYARRHARGKIKPPDDGSRKIRYIVWDR